MIAAVIIILLAIFLGLAAAFAFTVWMTVDMAMRKNWKDEDQKTLWIVLFVTGWSFAFAFIVAVIYYFSFYRDPAKKRPI
jgi:drug/metabolite transporter (DMT)-like permease